MTELSITASWQDGEKVRGSELKATWAAFRISVGDCNLTECFDDYGKTVRDEIIIPVYPIAEWFVSHWWRLWNETQAQISDATPTGHFFETAGEGFAVPNLRFWSEGSNLLLQAHSCTRPLAKIRFLSSGEYWLNTLQCMEEVSRFVELVLDRLDQQGISGTFLQREWAAIREVESQDDERTRQFCRCAGQMGLDPFDIDSILAAQIEKAIQSLPGSVHGDFFEIASLAGFETQLEALQSFWGQPSEVLSHEQPAANFKFPLPWQAGYDFANRLRSQQAIGTQSFKSVDELFSRFPFRSTNIALETLDIASVDAVLGMDPSNANSLRCAIRSGRPATRLFHGARALGELFYSGLAEPTLLTSVGQRDRQKRSRAFAAEFLAPAALIREKLSGSLINADEAQSIAESFGVSDLVIRDQVLNHDLAQIVM